MPNQINRSNMQAKKIFVQGKKGSYSIPAKFLKQQPVKQEKLYKEYWND